MAHLEAAITREQVLEEAWRWHEEQAKIYRYRSANTFVGGEHALSLMARAHDESAQHFRALVSTRQEPAPAADAEEVREAWVECDYENAYWVCIETPAQVCEFKVGPKHFADDLAKAINEHVKLAALRRYAGEVTDEMVEAATDRLVRFYSPGLRSLAKDAARSILQAAARAKSGEKDGAR